LIPNFEHSHSTSYCRSASAVQSCQAYRQLTATY